MTDGHLFNNILLGGRTGTVRSRLPPLLLGRHCVDFLGFREISSPNF
jgi:hypothetical protein